MKTLMYIHGYGSTGQALKAKTLQQMFPDAILLSPTLDYDRLAPREVFDQLREIIVDEKPEMIVGSSTGGYYALCCTQFYPGPVWCINPVRDILDTIDRLFPPSGQPTPALRERRAQYEAFDREVFQQLHPADGQLHFALSTDDELLGDHRPLLDRFPNYEKVIWKDHCGHRFFRFAELKETLVAQAYALSTQPH